MGKKQTTASQAAAKASKLAKAVQKVERKETKKALKSKSSGNKIEKGKVKKKKKADSDTDGEDLEDILEKIREEWEAAHNVTEELVEGPPSRRANATLIACPNGKHLWCIGGEFFSEDGKAYFYNDVFRYTPEKHEWRKFVSPTCPGPRSAHAVAASPTGGGKIFLFGGEFSSLHQNSFHHYRDFWCFDVGSHIWGRIDTKVRPSARSGHRMAVWKHLIILFGGFYDPGITTRYLNDLWVFDIQEYKWTQVEFREMDPRPSPRSGFSFLPCADGIVLQGGYCKEYLKGKRPVGVMLDDTWLLKITLPSDPQPTTPANAKSTISKSSKQYNGSIFKWEKRKRASDAYAPSLRSGCTMALWTSKSMGVLFGGVTDEDTSEETLESVFWNDLYAYQLIGKGRWSSLILKKPKAKEAARKGTRKKKQQRDMEQDSEDEPGKADDENFDFDVDGEDEVRTTVINTRIPPTPTSTTSHSDAEPTSCSNFNITGQDDPLLTVPMPRYNAMLAVLRNTLYIYGGIFERGSREYTLDDFYSVQLDKMDRFACLKRSEIMIPEGEEESSSSDEGDSDEDSDESDNGVDDSIADGAPIVGATEVKETKRKTRSREKKVSAEELATVIEAGGGEPESLDNDLRSRATAFMGVSKDMTRSAEDIQSTPLPGETLAMFYARSREYWTHKALRSSDNKGKQLRRDGFALAEERYVSYKPILEEVEKILEEAGLEEEEMRRGATMESAGGPGMSNRNRR